MSAIYDFIDGNELLIYFEEIKKEIKFDLMINQGRPVSRLVAIQGDIIDDVKPLYRHPTDKQPDITEWTPTVFKIKNYISTKLGQNLNHCLIQWYRNGFDNISDHCDKTLDIEMGTSIVNYSIGATRKMSLKPKNKLSNEDKRIILLKHNSLFVLDWETNKKYLHSIKADKRRECEKTEDERYCNGERISFTFRTIATFIDSNGVVKGQGAKTSVPTSDGDAMELLKAFSRENHEYEYDWHDIYGGGFNSFDFSTISISREND